MIDFMIKLIKKENVGKRVVFKLNEKKLISHLNSTWTSKNCSCCGQNNWNLGDQIVSMVGIGENKEMQIGGRFQPLVTMTCNNCGNTLFINALVAEAIDTDGEGK